MGGFDSHRAYSLRALNLSILFKILALSVRFFLTEKLFLTYNKVKLHTSNLGGDMSITHNDKMQMIDLVLQGELNQLIRYASQLYEANLDTTNLPALTLQEFQSVRTDPMRVIKSYRARTNCGLREAKVMVDRARELIR